MYLDMSSIIFSREIKVKIDCFVEKLLEVNKIHNLTSITTQHEVFTKHILDSLSGYFVMKDVLGDRIYDLKIVDIGTGAGFPSIPLMLYDDRLIVDVIESNGKKAAFLEEVKEMFGLKFQIINKNVKEVQEKFDVILFRAFADLAFFFKISKNVFNDRAYIFAYKGKKNNTLEELNLVKKRKIGLNIKACTIHNIVGLSDERNIVEIVWEK